MVGKTEGMYVGGIENITSFLITRNSLNNRGQALFPTRSALQGRHRPFTGLFRTNPSGVVDLVVSTMDTLPGISGPFTVRERPWTNRRRLCDLSREQRRRFCFLSHHRLRAAEDRLSRR